MEEYPIQKDEVMNVVAIIEAFYKSAQLGREVTAPVSYTPLDVYKRQPLRMLRFTCAI